MGRTRLFLIGLLGWYVLFAFWMGRSPVDSQFWTLASVPAGLFVTALVMTHRILPLSLASYALITAYLTLHTVGAHYTYAQTPVGFWLDQAMDLQRNHFDRIVHFSFGFLLTYPMEELFRLVGQVRGWLGYYLPVMTVLGLSGLWEIIESWVARAVHPDLGIAYLGSQGDVWDAQKDMAAALYGSLLCVAVILGLRVLRGSPSASPAPGFVETHS